MKTREEFVCWSHLGFDRDIRVFHTGATSHWTEETWVEDGAVISRRKFQGKDARERAIAHAVWLMGQDRIRI